ncbi:MAG: hypothetical protein AAFY31_07480 [Pseudomonadota bacterium]
MKCNQCNRPALYTIYENVPLCLACYSQWQHTQSILFLQNAAMLNQTQDDMDAAIGFSTGRSRIPVAEISRAIQGSHTLNNFHFTQPQIGVLNTGSIERIDQAISFSQGADTEDVADKLRLLLEAVVKSSEVDEQTRAEVVDLSDSIAGELMGSRKPATLTALAKSLKEKLGGVLALSNAADALIEAIKQLFQ